MVTLAQPDPNLQGLLVRFIDYPLDWLTVRHSPRGYLGDLFSELRVQWHAHGCPTGEQLDQRWLAICLSVVTRLNSPLYGGDDGDLGLVHWTFEASTSGNDVGSFIHYDHGAPAYE